jgi:hypothetical protein
MYLVYYRNFLQGVFTSYNHAKDFVRFSLNIEHLGVLPLYYGGINPPPGHYHIHLGNFRVGNLSVPRAVSFEPNRSGITIHSNLRPRKGSPLDFALKLIEGDPMTVDAYQDVVSGSLR